MTDFQVMLVVFAVVIALAALTYIAQQLGRQSELLDEIKDELASIKDSAFYLSERFDAEEAFEDKRDARNSN